jgi:anthranilate synthase component I
MVVKNGQVNVQAGAGLVGDSEPEKEYEETLNKARGYVGSDTVVRIQN